MKLDLLARYQEFSHLPENERPYYKSKDGRDVIRSHRSVEWGDVKSLDGKTALKKTASLDEIDAFVSEVKSTGTLSKFFVPFGISTMQGDRTNDIIDLNGWKLQNYILNPVVFRNHCSWDHPVANGFNVGVVEDRLRADVRFHGQTPDSYDTGILTLLRVYNATSIGGIPLDWEDMMLDEALRAQYRIIYPHPNSLRIFRSMELYEFSIVGVPANPGAVREKSFNEDAVRRAIERGYIKSDSPALPKSPIKVLPINTGKSMDNNGAPDPSQQLEAIAPQMVAGLFASTDQAELGKGALTAIAAYALGLQMICQATSLRVEDEKIKKLAQSISKPLQTFLDEIETLLKGEENTDTTEGEGTTTEGETPVVTQASLMSKAMGIYLEKGGQVLRADLKAKLQTAKSNIDEVLQAANPAEEATSTAEAGKSAPAWMTKFQADMTLLFTEMNSIKSAVTGKDTGTQQKQAEAPLPIGSIKVL